MAGLIKAQSLEEVRSRVHIEELIGEYVALKPAGVGSMKGLCPFHDEKTPSFNVRPQMGFFHCFGCGESGDAIAFVEKIEHVSFVEAVEFLARKVGVELEYDESRGEKRGPSEVTRARLIDAHRVAEEFYVSQLSTPEAAPARDMLAGRNFDAEAIAHFRVGYSPNSWDALLTQLRKRGFTEKEIAASGLATQGTRGMYDRFRGRVMWPIRSVTGDPIGFGARKLSDDDGGPKYLNTPETMIYKKSQVLYGLDLAKKSISKERQIVVVEGYTDVMAAHLAGVPNAVATCGTAFGNEHVKIVRRLMGDSANPAAGVILSSGRAYGGEVIFTFDGDSAGQKAAMRAFREDQNFAAQTFVAVSPGGLDPCDLRLKYGDEAVRQLVKEREPLFAFVIRSVLREFPLGTAEGRAAGLRAAAPILNSIRDRVLRGEYVRQLAGWLGMEEHVVRGAVHDAARHHTQIPQLPAEAEERPNAPVLADRRTIRDPIERVEREALEVIVQLPVMAVAANAGQLPAASFQVPVHRAIFDAIRAAGGPIEAKKYADSLVEAGASASDAENRAAGWFVEKVAEESDDIVRRAIVQLAVEPLAQADVSNPWPYVRGIMMSLIRAGITRQIADVRSQMQRTEPNSPEQEALFNRLMELEAQRRIFVEES
ncbi:DNA primase [Arcanobacterium wilhelmae]|uniref:DNA primase n=1 Tax=Arcanobacterium wilhelmae TaxID=1803177 RepID=A0ABT9N9L8_9ACTO|nr:DNA primase [Arcanobacterium wilhelmae]MDP9800223.1 DNA primase [Arcanobacterium wilhelmae]WFN89662.1 DNA primase [Arcanobacterium wilhelmae]